MRSVVIGVAAALSPPSSAPSTDVLCISSLPPPRLATKRGRLVAEHS